MARRDERGQINVEQAPDVIDGKVRRRIGGQRFRVVGIMSLTRKHCGDTSPPDLLDRGQDAKLVVDENVVLSRIALFDVVQFPFLVNVNQDAATDRIEYARSL